MFDWKSLADTITLLRGALAILFIWLGINAGQDGLAYAAILLILCWTGDSIDGGFAKKSKPPRRTWIGDRDMEMDIFVSLCLGLYLILAGYIPSSWAIGYVATWAIIFVLSGRNHALLELVQAPIYLAMILIALANAQPAGLLLVGWIFIALVINRSRFMEHTVPEFLSDMRDALSQKRKR